jgi:hypothetical protein
MELGNGGGCRFHHVRSLQHLQLDGQHLRQHPVSAPAVTASSGRRPAAPQQAVLPAFWISEPVAWFAPVKAKFRTSHITSQSVMFDLLVSPLREKNLSQVMDFIKNIPVSTPSRSSSSGSWRPTCCPTRRRWTPCSSWVPYAITSLLSSWPPCCECALQVCTRCSWYSSTSSSSDYPRRCEHYSASRSAATSAPWWH